MARFSFFFFFGVGQVLCCLVWAENCQSDLATLHPFTRSGSLSAAGGGGEIEREKGSGVEQEGGKEGEGRAHRGKE